MTDRLDAEVRTVAQLFGDDEATYTVPIYQRNYAWRAEQIEQLIADVQDALEDDDKEYFLGNLVVTRRPGQAVDYEVIDGQQRLTTLYLLLTLLERDGGGGYAAHSDRLRYESRTRATEALRRIGTFASRHASPPAQVSSEEDAGIHEGYNVVRQFLDQHPQLRTSEGRGRFADYLRHQVTVVRASLPPTTDLNRYFEVMNTRGQQLQQVDIVKARLMSQLPDEAEQACLAWIWDACADMDSYVQMSLTRGSPAQRAQLFGEGWLWLEARGFDELLATFQAAEGADGTGLGCGSMSLDEALARYATQEAATRDEDDDNVRFRSTIEFPAFLLHVLKVIASDSAESETQLDDKRLIARFADAMESASDRAEWVRSFGFSLLRLRNLFDAFVLKRQHTATNGEDGDWSLQRLAKGSRPPGRTTSPPRYLHTFSGGQVEVEEDGASDDDTAHVLLLESMLRVTYTSPRTMHWMTLLLRAVADRPPEQIRAAHLVAVLRDYARGKVREAFFAGDEPQGFDISRIVFTYLDYLLQSDGGSAEYRFAFRNSIEHFFPQHPDEEQEGAVVSADCLNLLGNLALVSVGANSKFSNSLPSAKAWNYQTTIEAQSPKLHLMADTTRRDERWDDDQVRGHHAAMVDLLRRDVGGTLDPHSAGGDPA